LRVLIDKALTRGYVLLPLAAPHHRRDGLVFGGPSTKGKQSWPSPGGGRGNHSMSYERSRTPFAARNKASYAAWTMPYLRMSSVEPPVKVIATLPAAVSRLTAATTASTRSPSARRLTIVVSCFVLR
jgi:hypothetical protein